LNKEQINTGYYSTKANINKISLLLHTTHTLRKMFSKKETRNLSLILEEYDINNLDIKSCEVEEITLTMQHGTNEFKISP
jgi:hypothetical protein